MAPSNPRAGWLLVAGLALLSAGVSIGAGACNRAPQPRDAESLRPEPTALAVPFVLELYGPAAPSGDALTLTAKLRGSGSELPVELEVVLPPGASLTEGAPQERVRLSAEQPLIERRYTLALARPLVEPVRVRARLSDNPAMGAFAERLYPAPAKETNPTASTEPSRGRVVAGVPIGEPTEAVKLQ